ncbi:serine/threonine-protein kinase [Streptomyces sp. NPDC050400]|uniref:serine/threonine-protein kinase n=1 Tax=Streptomyces sp. NPDC050400 TaxID=3365610 RepID=UPI003793180D
MGRLVGGRYRLVERIGSGGMGTVWRADDELVGREVAVKEPRLPGDPHGEAQQRAYARLQREARAAARVEHPSAVAIHDVVVEDRLPWIVMELVRGESLHEALKRGPLPPPEAARIGLAVLGALRAAHAKGIVHRDVKPANVLLGPHGRVVLTDFGIAHIQGEESLTVSGEFVGSLECIAPERMSGDGAGPSSDLWSLGVLLYAAVEGWSPFRRTTLESTLAAILSVDPPPAERAGALGPLVGRLLVKDPAGRPDPAAVEAGLAAAAEGRPLPEPFGQVAAQDPAALRELGDDVGTVRLAAPEREALVGKAAATGRKATPDTTPDPSPEAAPDTRAAGPGGKGRGRRSTATLVVAALVGAVLVGGGVWLGTSLGTGGGDGAPWSEGSGGELQEASVMPDEPENSSTPGKEKGWTVRKESAVRAVVAVPDELTDVYHDPSDDGVQYSDPKSDVTLSLKRWAAVDGGSSAVAWATSAGDSYADKGCSDIRRNVTRTSFHGKDAAQLDITYLDADGSSRMREMRLYVVDGKSRYDLGVIMPKGVARYEKQGTDTFKGARDRLELEKS